MQSIYHKLQLRCQCPMDLKARQLYIDYISRTAETKKNKKMNLKKDGQNLQLYWRHIAH